MVPCTFDFEAAGGLVGISGGKWARHLANKSPSNRKNSLKLNYAAKITKRITFKLRHRAIMI